MAKEIPRNPDSITPQWLTAALQSNGTIGEAIVDSFTIKFIGEDESFSGGALLQMEINYCGDEQADAPASLIAKLSPNDPEMRLLLKDLNSRETYFYTELAPQSNPLVPRCFYSDFDAETGECILLLEDLSHLHAVAFTAGCEPKDVEHVVQALARFHAHWWDSPNLKELGGASILSEIPFSEVWPLYREKIAALLPGFLIPDTFFMLGEHVAANEFSVFNRLLESEPITCIHRDIHVDNILFSQQADDSPVKVLDWALVGKGRGVYDVAYFLISSVSSEQRRQTEKNLLRTYHSALVQYGVEDYSYEQCWFDYKLAVIGKLFVTVGATVLADNSTPHKKAWRKADLQRLLAFCDDHSVNELLLSIDDE